MRQFGCTIHTHAHWRDNLTTLLTGAHLPAHCSSGILLVISHTQSLSPALDNFCSAHGELVLVTATLPALKLLSLLANLQHSGAQCKMSHFMSFCLRWLGTLNFRSLSRASLIRIHFCSTAFIFHHSGGWEVAGFCTSEIKYKWQIYRWCRKQNLGIKTRVRELEVEECCGWNQSAGLGITSETWKPYLTFNKA